MNSFCFFFTTRKRSLRRLCFHKRLSFCPTGGGHVWRGGGVHAGETATEAGGTHPTGMHSCCFCSLKPNNLTCQLHWCLTKSFCKVISLNYPYVSAFLLDSSSLFTEKLKCFSVISSSLKIMI